MTPIQLCSQVASPAVGTAKSVVGNLQDWTYLATIQASLVGGGSATVKIQASNDNLSWLDLATITLSSSTPSEGLSIEVPWRWLRSNVTAVATGKVDAVVVV